eukprot:CAMPEP_0197926270 /NCGR_PEP_ID=MMETSP1439-20131203/98865_1 /TAXON_ID=66791 /ORGANISM="Gonyaulax spinifera, Strain CCMP409" /LENGTH=67 /DNA_ID=CAMNT_0043548797 /DNA_START=88 /DNA_END=288 /DNA_ORIENTATION=-
MRNDRGQLFQTAIADAVLAEVKLLQPAAPQQGRRQRLGAAVADAPPAKDLPDLVAPEAELLQAATLS